MIDDTELAPTHILIVKFNDGTEQRWGPTPRRLAELKRAALEDEKPEWYRSSKIEEAES